MGHTDPLDQLADVLRARLLAQAGAGAVAAPQRLSPARLSGRRPGATLPRAAPCAASRTPVRPPGGLRRPASPVPSWRRWTPATSPKEGRSAVSGTVGCGLETCMVGRGEG